MFTFSICTYNHSKYIIQHLESIKYIINEYSHEQKTHLLICDDYSTDDTIYKIEKWLDKNSDIFKKHKLVKSKINQGTVNNFKTLISNIETPYFKLLAGDDIYNKYDVVNRYSSKNLIVGFSLPFNLSKNNYFEDIQSNYFTRQRMFLLNNNSNFFKRYIIANNSLSAPGMGYNIEWLKDEDLNNYFNEIKYIEDRPLWYFIFKNKKINIELELTPYVLYRTNVGVTSKSSKFHQEYLNDLKKIDKLFFKDTGYANKFFKKLYFKILFNIYKKNIFSYSKKISRYESNIKSNFTEYQKHIDFIINKAEGFESEN